MSFRENGEGQVKTTALTSWTVWLLGESAHRFMGKSLSKVVSLHSRQ